MRTKRSGVQIPPGVLSEPSFRRGPFVALLRRDCAPRSDGSAPRPAATALAQLARWLTNSRHTSVKDHNRSLPLRRLRLRDDRIPGDDGEPAPARDRKAPGSWTSGRILCSWAITQRMPGCVMPVAEAADDSTGRPQFTIEPSPLLGDDFRRPVYFSAERCPSG